MSTVLLEVTGLTSHFARRGSGAGEDPAHAPGAHKGVLPATCDVTFSIAEGETIGLAGEPGSGKTTLARMLAGTLEPTRGIIAYRGVATGRMTRRQKLDWLRGIQMMFEHPDAALNPRLCAFDIIADAPLTHRLVTRRAMAGHVAAVMEEVGLDPARAGSYPHEFLPDERHRIALARALAVQPSLLVCDQFARAFPPEAGERLLNLVVERCVARGIACLLIGDRIAELGQRCERVAVLYRGHLLEMGPATSLRGAPNHPYSQSQLAGEPSADVADTRQGAIEIGTSETACIYQPRCLYAGSRCRLEQPRLREIAPAHVSACHLNDASGQ